MSCSSPPAPARTPPGGPLRPSCRPPLVWPYIAAKLRHFSKNSPINAASSLCSCILHYRSTGTVCVHKGQRLDKLQGILRGVSAFGREVMRPHHTQEKPFVRPKIGLALGGG